MRHLSVCVPKTRAHSFQNPFEKRRFVFSPVEEFGNQVWENAVFPEKSINFWLKSRSLNTNLD